MLNVSILEALATVVPIVFCTANVGVFDLCGEQPVQPIGVVSDSTAVIL